MARSPNQDKNLIPLGSGKRTKSEEREIQSKGGKKSGKTRGAMKTFRKALVDGLTSKEQAVMLEKLKENAEEGNLAAFEFLLKLIGQHPDQQGDTDSEVIIRMEGGSAYDD